jgi:N-acetylneuraminic acid mutarotase
MTRPLFALLVAGMAVTTARAHFVYVVPAKDGSAATVVLSDDLEPDDGVSMANVAGLKLFVRDLTGTDTPAEVTAGPHSLAAKLAGTGPRVAFGSVTFGVRQRGEEKAFLLIYHPKALVGPVPADKAGVGEKLLAELLPVTEDGKVRFRLVAGGKPVADAEVSVLKPDGSKAKVKTDKDGLTDAVEGKGRFGAWARVVLSKSGEHDGKKYAEVRHYPTLVFDTPEASYPPLPTAVSSLGAVECDGYLYVYGGHAGKTHSYDTKTVVGSFHRLKLNGGTKWEELPGGPILQGMNLAAHEGKVYRVGGMQPRNAPGEPTDNHSVRDVARFDPKVGKWEAMPSLPAGRSSHDVVVSGNKLVVVGGWDQKGKGQRPVWHDTALVLDLAASSPEWKSIPQPFKRRALSAAAVGSKAYVIAGLGADGGDKRVDVLDVATGTWATGPMLPGGDRVAFAPAAGVVNGQVVVNTFEGPVYRLTTGADAWEKVGVAVHRRMVARLVAFGKDAIVLVGGASGARNVGEVEVVRLAERGERAAAGQ